MSTNEANATTQENAGATSGEGTNAGAQGLSDDAKKVIAGLNRDASQKAETIKQVAEALGIDPKELNAEKVRALIAPAKEAEEKSRDSIRDRRAALAEFVGDDRYTEILPQLKYLAEKGEVLPTKELAETLLSSAQPSTSGPRSTGGNSGRPTVTPNDEDLMKQLKSRNLWGEPI